MPTKSLNGYIWFDAANSLEDSAHRAARDASPHRVVPSDHKQVDRLGVVHSLLKPWLLHHVSCFDDLGDVAVSGEVEEDTEGHDAKACLYQHMVVPTGSQLTLLCGEITVTSSDVLELASSWVHDLHIASEILVSVDLGEVVKSLVGDLGNIKLVIADGQQVVVDVFENDIRDVAIGRRRIAKSRAIM